MFHGSTRDFLATASGEARGVAIDLGCGPGFTTHLVADVLRCERTIGLDASRQFIELARATANRRVGFELHDICEVPFPAAPAGLIFCRFLLTHLKQPASVAAKWATQLAPGGLLMIEESESISTDYPAFRRYLEIVEAMLASQSNCLYAGKIVADLESHIGLKTHRTRLRRVRVTDPAAAQMFAMNMQAWKGGAFICANYSREEIAALETTFLDLSRNGSRASNIEWSLRQATFRR